MTSFQAIHSRWERAIIFVDMNAFFASVEQLDHPKWRGKPIAVTNGETGTAIITCSYEARRYRIHTGMRIREAKKLCSTLIQVSSRPDRYIEISDRIMEALNQITPDIEVASIDEAYLDITHCQQLYASPLEAAQKTQALVWKVSQLPCSIGLSSDKTTAKWAAESKKPNGFTVIPPWEVTRTLANVPASELCGVGKKMAEYLARYGARTCQEVARLPISLLSKKFGNIGRRIWLMCQGKDPTPVHTEVSARKSLGHGKILPPDTRDLEVIKAYFLYMSEKVAARLRRNHLYASHFFIGMCVNRKWKHTQYKLTVATQSADDIYAGCEKFLKEAFNGEAVRQVQVTALDPQNTLAEVDLLEDNSLAKQKRMSLEKVRDSINHKFGEFKIKPAALLTRKNIESAQVIPPSFK